MNNIIMSPMIMMIANILVIVGALNWGLVGILDINLVTMILPAGMMVKLVYSLVGLSGLLMLMKMIMGDKKA